MNKFLIIWYFIHPAGGVKAGKGRKGYFYRIAGEIAPVKEF